MRVVAMLAVCLLLSAARVDVEPVEWQDNEDGKIVTIHIDGRIEPGDLDRMKRAWDQAMSDRKLIVALELSSWGGDGDTAIMLADFVHKYPVKVLVDYRCWSACSFPALVALGKGKLLVRNGADVGVHQAWDEDGKADVEWTKMAARILRKYGAPNAALKAMVSVTPGNLKHYYADDLVAMGATKIDSGWWSWVPWE